VHGFGVHVHTYIRTCTTHSCSQVSEAQEETPPENDSSSDSDSDDDDVQIHIGEIKTAPYLQYVVTVY